MDDWESENSHLMFDSGDLEPSPSPTPSTRRPDPFGLPRRQMAELLHRNQSHFNHLQGVTIDSDRNQILQLVIKLNRDSQHILRSNQLSKKDRDSLRSLQESIGVASQLLQHLLDHETPTPQNG